MVYDLGVALLPNDEIKKLMIELNRMLKSSHEVSYELGDTNHPHLTLYQGTFESFEDVHKAVTGLDLNISETEIVLKNLILHPSNFLTFQCYQTERLQRLHETVLNGASEVRLRDVPTIWERNRVQFGPKQQASIKRYGYPDALELFDPHFTIRRITAREFDRTAVITYLMQKAVPYIGYKLKPSAIVIYELGIDAACVNPRRIK